MVRFALSHSLLDLACLASLVAFGSMGGPLGCSSPSEGTTPSDAGTDTSSFCATDTRGLKWTPGLAQTGKNGLIRTQLLNIFPTPPAKGDNVWTLVVQDAEGKPLEGATVSVKPFMPDHGHGSSIVPHVTPDPASGGKYSISSLNLFMPGLWQTTLTITAGTTTDSVVYGFCVAE